ncbi:hypothetical protein FXO38_07157 [Capsicum annuum]|nr:hypothetical protein FXO38_07157 [Capsicum annuum]KAF3672375.1 hypothetical protein FXO37_07540 [Capsicum annuum]
MLYDVSCGSERFKTFKSQSLTILKLRTCFGIKEIDAPNLVSAECKGYHIPDGFLQNLISRSQFLESLMIANVSDRELGRFNICKSQSLTILKLWNCDGITEIDATNLISIEYRGIQIPELKLGRESSQLKHSKIDLFCNSNVNAAWFGKLGSFYQIRPVGLKFPFISLAAVGST